MNRVKAVILGNEVADDHRLWMEACEELKECIEYRVVNLTSDAWLEEIQDREFDVLLAKPSWLTASFKQLYDERIYILGKILCHRVFPSPDEIFLYENKRFLYAWLQANRIPHPRTHVFSDRLQALRHLQDSDFPVIAKTSIGASGSGVKKLCSRMEAAVYIENAFSEKGAAKRAGPNPSRGGWLKRGFHYVLFPGNIKKKLNIYRAIRSDKQTGLVILQEFVPHEFEWRVVRIGESFFAHKKLKTGDRASGSLLKEYGAPPTALLDFARRITDEHGFFSMAMDIFESPTGYLVNEMQCIFGQSDPYQMLVDGRPGRYIRAHGKWVFEEGDFNRNESFNLRVRFVVETAGERAKG